MNTIIIFAKKLEKWGMGNIFSDKELFWIWFVNSLLFVGLGWTVLYYTHSMNSWTVWLYIASLLFCPLWTYFFGILGIVFFSSGEVPGFNKHTPGFGQKLVYFLCGNIIQIPLWFEAVSQ